MDDLISRAAAIECAIDAVDDWDGGWNPNRETVIRKYFAEVPAVDAVPVEWLREKMMMDVYDSKLSISAENVLDVWQKQQEAR